MAAQRNDVQALRLLLQYRANPEICDFEHCTPLRHTTFGPLSDDQEPEAMQLLLHNRVNVLPDPEHGVTALHDAAFHHNHLRFIKPLIEAGCPVDHRERGSHAGHTPLARAALKDRDLTAAYLIEHGADVNNIDERGDSVLATAVQNGSKKVLRLLWKHGATHLTTNNSGYSILHTAAGYRAVDTGTLALLREARLKGLDTGARCKAGLTASQLLQARDDVSDDFRWGFVALLESVELQEPVSYGPKLQSVWPITLM